MSCTSSPWKQSSGALFVGLDSENGIAFDMHSLTSIDNGLPGNSEETALAT